MSDVPDDRTEMQSAESTTQDVRLHHGEELVGIEANVVAIAAPTRVVVVAGDVGAGKTTLLTSIYERFQRGAIGAFSFAGSLTLVGFERRCHASRIASGRSVPDTDRTRRSEETAYLHLRVKEVSCGSRYDLLFTDISGEAFQAARDSSTDARRLDVLHRADHFLLLVDCARLVNRGARHEAAHGASTLLRSLHESSMLTASASVDILLSKYDLVDAAIPQQDQQFIRAFGDRLTQAFAPRFSEFRVAPLAARPARPDYPDNIDDLFQHWVITSPYERHAARHRTDATQLGTCYDRFLLTTRDHV